MNQAIANAIATLEQSAKQHLSAEWTDDEDGDNGDLVYAYDQLVTNARSALADLKQWAERQENTTPEALERLIAAHFDHPSVYMGGPSKRGMRQAQDLIREIGHAGFLMVAQSAGESVGRAAPAARETQPSDTGSRGNTTPSQAGTAAPPADYYEPCITDLPDAGLREFVIRDCATITQHGESYDTLIDMETREVVGFAWPIRKPVPAQDASADRRTEERPIDRAKAALLAERSPLVSKEIDEEATDDEHRQLQRIRAALDCLDETLIFNDEPAEQPQEGGDPNSSGRRSPQSSENKSMPASGPDAVARAIVSTHVSERHHVLLPELLRATIAAAITQAVIEEREAYASKVWGLRPIEMEHSSAEMRCWYEARTNALKEAAAAIRGRPHE